MIKSGKGCSNILNRPASSVSRGSSEGAADHDVLNMPGHGSKPGSRHMSTKEDLNDARVRAGGESPNKSTSRKK